MNRMIITTSLFATVLLLLTPAIPPLQYTTVVTANTTDRIQQIQNIDKNGMEERLRSIDFPRLKDTLQNIPANESRQKIKEMFNTTFQNLVDKFLRILLLYALIAYLVTYAIGGSLGYAIDITLYLLTRGKWEFLNAITIAFLPSEFFFWIMVAIYEIGMRLCGWPFPDDPGGHSLSEREKIQPVIFQKYS